MTTVNLVNIHYLEIQFLKGRHLSSFCISKTPFEILDYFLCVNFTPRLKNQVPFENFMIFKSLFFIPHLYLTQNTVTLKRKWMEGWWTSHFSLRHPHKWYVKSKMLLRQKGMTVMFKRSLNGQHIANLNLLQEAKTICPWFGCFSLLFHLTFASQFFFLFHLFPTVLIDDLLLSVQDFPLKPSLL